MYLIPSPYQLVYATLPVKLITAIITVTGIKTEKLPEVHLSS